VTEYRTILDRFDGALNERFDYFMHHPTGNPNQWISIHCALKEGINGQDFKFLKKNSGAGLFDPKIILFRSIKEKLL